MGRELVGRPAARRRGGGYLGELEQAGAEGRGHGGGVVGRIGEVRADGW